MPSVASSMGVLSTLALVSAPRQRQQRRLASQPRAHHGHADRAAARPVPALQLDRRSVIALAPASILLAALPALAEEPTAEPIAEAAAPAAPAPAEILGNAGNNPQSLGDGYQRFFGKATSSSSYAGYGGNDNNDNQFKYYFDIPEGWKADTINKTEKSTNGTDARYVSAKGRSGPRIYLTTFNGYTKLKPDRKSIMSDLALSDYDLQDALQTAEARKLSKSFQGGGAQEGRRAGICGLHHRIRPDHVPDERHERWDEAVCAVLRGGGGGCGQIAGGIRAREGQLHHYLRCELGKAQVASSRA